MQNSLISWCEHSLAPWFVCSHERPGCLNCYAEARERRFHPERGWGPGAPRVRAAASTLRRPFAWNRKAEAAGEPAFVFCSELSDVFDAEVPPEWRAELFDTIRATPWLVWLLLTKRARNIRGMLPPEWGDAGWPQSRPRPRRGTARSPTPGGQLPLLAA